MQRAVQDAQEGLAVSGGGNILVAASLHAFLLLFGGPEVRSFGHKILAKDRSF